MKTFCFLSLFIYVIMCQQ